MRADVRCAMDAVAMFSGQHLPSVIHRPRHVAPRLLLTILCGAGLGCAQRPVVGDMPAAPPASAPVDAPAEAVPSETGSSAGPAAGVGAAFPPGAGHSRILDPGGPFTQETIHRYRGGDDLPRLEAVAPVLRTTRRLAVVPGALQVRTSPNAVVAAWASALGTFADGASGVLVSADAEGLAVIDVRIGIDGGDYPFFLTSPTRSGVVVIHLNAE